MTTFLTIKGRRIFPVIKSNSSKLSISDNFVDLWRDYILDNPYGSLNGWIDLLSTQTNKLATGGIYKEEVNVLHKKLAFKNYEAQYRVIIIWMPEKMNLESSNSMLKLLEEPPKGTVFLLVSENLDLLIATIKSRLQIIQVHDFTLEDMINYFPHKAKSEILKVKNDNDINIEIINNQIIFQHNRQMPAILFSCPVGMILRPDRAPRYHGNAVVTFLTPIGQMRISGSNKSISRKHIIRTFGFLQT